MNLKKLTRMTVLVAMALVSSCVGKTLPSEAPASSALTPTALTPIALTEIKPANRSEAPAPSASTLSEIKRIKDIHPAKRSKAQMKKLRELSNIPKPEQVLAGRSPGGVQRVARAQLQKFYAQKAALKAANSSATDMPGSFHNRTPAEPAQPSPAAAALQDTTGTGLVEIKAVDHKASDKKNDLEEKRDEQSETSKALKTNEVAELQAQLAEAKVEATKLRLAHGDLEEKSRKMEEQIDSLMEAKSENKAAKMTSPQLAGKGQQCVLHRVEFRHEPGNRGKILCKADKLLTEEQKALARKYKGECPKDTSKCWCEEAGSFFQTCGEHEFPGQTRGNRFCPPFWTEGCDASHPHFSFAPSSPREPIVACCSSP